MRSGRRQTLTSGDSLMILFLIQKKVIKIHLPKRTVPEPGPGAHGDRCRRL